MFGGLWSSLEACRANVVVERLAWGFLAASWLKLGSILRTLVGPLDYRDPHVAAAFALIL